MKKVTVLGVLLLVLALLAAGCAPKAAPAPTPAPAQPAPAPAPAPSEWDKVLEAAKKEGALTLYSTFASQVAEPARAAMKGYGIVLETVGGRGGELEQRLRTEQQAGATMADLLLTGWTNVVNSASAGFVQAPPVALPTLAEKDVWKVHPSQYGTEGVFVLGRGINLTAIVNTDQVAKGEITTWNDFLDPKWKGKMILQDPRTGSGPGSSGLGAWMTLGEEFWKKMAAQNMTMQASYDMTIDEVVQGSKAIAIFPAFGSRLNEALRAGAPIRVVHVKEGTPDFLYGVALIKNAPHPNAAMVFVNWLLSKQGQAAAGKGLGNYIIRKDVTEDWFAAPELRSDAFTWLELPNLPSASLDPDIPRKGAEFGKKIFGGK